MKKNVFIKGFWYSYNKRSKKPNNRMVLKEEKGKEHSLQMLFPTFLPLSGLPILKISNQTKNKIEMFELLSLPSAWFSFIVPFLPLHCSIPRTVYLKFIWAIELSENSRVSLGWIRKWLQWVTEFSHILGRGRRMVSPSTSPWGTQEPEMPSPDPRFTLCHMKQPSQAVTSCHQQRL